MVMGMLVAVKRRNRLLWLEDMSWLSISCPLRLSPFLLAMAISIILLELLERVGRLRWLLNLKLKGMLIIDILRGN